MYVRKTGLLLLGLGLLCLFFSSSQPVFADTMPGGNVADPAVRAVDLAQPAVVRIITAIPAHLKVHFPPTTDVTFPTTSGASYQLQSYGTGTFITSQGDILTADHVVHPQSDKSLDATVAQAAAQDIATYMNQNGKAGNSQITSDQVIQQINSGELQTSVSYDTTSSTVLLSTGYTGPLTAPDLKSLPAGVALQVDKIEKESPPDQEDIAIIHVPMKDAPSVVLGDSSRVNVQDSLTIIGFPGNADINARPTDLLTSSVNQIYVSSLKSSQNGAPLIQVGGNVEKGDSGGPALDKAGNIVGIVSFASSQSGAPGATNYLQASNSARDMVASLNLDTTPGTFQKSWTQAFTAYADTTSGHWDQAKRDFQQLASNYPLFKGMQSYQSYAQTQSQVGGSTGSTLLPTPTSTPTASRPSHTQPTSTTALVLTIGSLILVGLLMIGLLFAIIKVKGKGRTGKSPKTQGSDHQNHQPAPTPVTSAPAPTTPQVPKRTQETLSLKVWPCGHMNRSNARFCSICGEPAPS
ncbi:S1 family peptidase [Tengunoibacter tsumagoiensis]|uniref:Trypsin-like serine protease n=1 Tax=Tengunoibacter tsumagoiensis TaxID=2014871 RepID=A0A401ZVD2_9CHLR|nr:serine protease [Tengunoibacter tsumagoiensis]GCE10684.1 hypothetical protein KTT_05430 [Tengunoibacter tsumagoiensis]